jgi:hypothetical protein
VEPDPLPPLFVLVLVLSLVELPPELVPEPLVVPEPVPEPLTEPEPLPDPVPLDVPERVDDDDPSEQPYNPKLRLNDRTAAVNKYLWFFIDPPFLASNRYARPSEEQPICHLVTFWRLRVPVGISNTSCVKGDRDSASSVPTLKHIQTIIRGINDPLS